MRIAIGSKSDSVLTSIMTPIAKNGHRTFRITNFKSLDLSRFEIAFIDLDNLPGDKDELKRACSNTGKTLVVGISRNNEVCDEFRGLMTINKKPLTNNDIKKYIEDTRKIIGSNYTINDSQNRVVDALGVSINKEQKSGVLTDDEQKEILKNKILKSSADIKSEKDFLYDIDIGDVIVPEKKVVYIQPPSIIPNFFVDEALTRYRRKKLQQLGITEEEIEQRILELNERKIRKDSVKRISDSQKKKDELLARLKRGDIYREALKREEEKQKPAIRERQESVAQEKDAEKKPFSLGGFIKDRIFEPDEEAEKPKIEGGPDKKEAEQKNNFSESKKDTVPEIREEKPASGKIIPEPESREEKKNIQDYGISEEKEAEIKKKLSLLRSRRKTPNPDSAGTDVQENSENSLSKNANPVDTDSRYEIHEDKQGQDGSEDKRLQEIDRAITKLGGHRESIQNKADPRIVKNNSEADLTQKLPNHSLFELVRNKVGSAPIEDEKTKRKKEMAKRVKPPSR